MPFYSTVRRQDLQGRGFSLSMKNTTLPTTELGRRFRREYEDINLIFENIVYGALARV